MALNKNIKYESSNVMIKVFVIQRYILKILYDVKIIYKGVGR
jgi:hypothetical protein